MADQAASGLRDLPRNGAWLLSKALRSPVAATESAVHDTSDGFRRVTTVVADKLPGGPDSVGVIPEGAGTVNPYDEDRLWCCVPFPLYRRAAVSPPAGQWWSARSAARTDDLGVVKG
jgi:hypothetical protein